MLEEDLDVARIGRGLGRCWNWKRIETLLEEDPDVAGIGRGSVRCWKMIRMQLLEMEEDPPLLEEN